MVTLIRQRRNVRIADGKTTQVLKVNAKTVYVTSVKREDI